jgi:hypothetical protein
MKKIRSVLPRYRLMVNVLALVFVLSTFAAPAAADIVPPWGTGGPLCEDGCWNWNEQQGCINCQRCCSDPSLGHYCQQVANNSCS